MSVVCQEIFDDISRPSEEEVHDYAKKIGIDPDSEPQLLPLAEEGLMKALPKGWRPCYDENSKSYYYHNSETGKTQWEHPLDDVYRGLVRKARTESQSLSLGEPTEDATYIRDELPSYEEPAGVNNHAPSKRDCRPSSPLKTRPLPGSPVKQPLTKQKSEERPASPAKFALKTFCSFDSKRDLESLNMSQNKELKVTGGGAVFLKSNTRKSSRATSPVKPAFLSPEAPPRSILRDRSSLEVSRSMEFDRSLEKSDKDDEDRKSVRFNLDNNTDAALSLSDKSSSNENSPDDAGNGAAVNVKTSLSRFTVMPVGENAAAAAVKNDGNLKLIKPNPTDFIKPKLTVTRGSDSDEDSLLKIFDKQAKLFRGISESDNSSPEDDKEENGDDDDDDAFDEEAVRQKTQRKIDRLRNSIWEEKNDELRRFTEDVRESHKKELERVLTAEKGEHEANIKRELEELRREMENRSVGTLREEHRALEAKLEEEVAGLRATHEKELQAAEASLADELEGKRRVLEERYLEKTRLLEAELEEKLEKRRQELTASHGATVEQLKENHSIIIEELKKEFAAEELALRQRHHELKGKISSEEGADSDRKPEPDAVRGRASYEKIRCEKRLLEDKYRCLKEKYLKLKGDVKLSIEKRNRKREQSGTTGSETERSHSINRERAADEAKD